MPSGPSKTVITSLLGFGMLVDLGEQLPGVGDRVFLEVVAEAEKLPSISKNVWWRAVTPTFSRSLCLPLMRMHFWLEVARL
jgi:hypothetical protein